MPSDPPADSPHPLDELAQLPHGRHGLPRDFVEHNQRQRLIVSFIRLVGEFGYADSTVIGATEGAGISSRTFYDFFETIDDLCIAAFQQGTVEMREVVVDAWSSQERWPQRVHAALAALLREFAEVPGLARLLTAEPFVAGHEIARLHKAALEEMVPYLCEGRELLGDPNALPDSAERGFLGAVNSTIARKVLAGEAESLPELLPDLTQFLLAPYLGAQAASEVTA